jgi:carbamoyltransferase
MNSVANGRIYAETPFRQLYVQAAAGDAGGAIGAALVAWQRVCPRDATAVERGFAMEHAYWGPQYTDAEIAAAIRNRESDLRHSDCTWTEIASEGDLCRMAAEVIAAGKVLGWFQGRMEWGPRALGNRSILCDPRRPDMKDILNLKIKRRESFRPFAPSILREAVSQWFDADDDVPFMMQVYPIRADKRALIPAVTHVDGTGRLQTVTRDSNARYYRLIEAFAALSGVPLVLNTSFNENEPVVCRPDEALDCFLRTRMDVLVLNNVVVSRNA